MVTARPYPRSRAPHRLGPRLACALAILTCLAGCAPQGEALPTPTAQVGAPLVIALIVRPPTAEGSGDAPVSRIPPNAAWALENINGAGGVAGRALQIEPIERAEDLRAQALEIAADDRFVAAIAPEGSADLATFADAFLAHQKPLISATSGASDLLRAYGGAGYIWRTRESDIAQVEVILHGARARGSRSVALLTSLESAAYTTFSWFGFFALELGFPPDAVHIETFDLQDCQRSVQAILDVRPDTLVVAPSAPEELDCLLEGLPETGAPRPSVIVADTGLNPYGLLTQETAEGVEGLAAFGDETYAAAWREREGPEAPLPPHGPSQYDAVLLLAYGLEISAGAGGPALASALKTLADAQDTGPRGWDQAGIAQALSALRAGRRPRLYGATGPLVFEPDLYMDLAASTLSRWRSVDGSLEIIERLYTGDPAYLSSVQAMVEPSPAHMSPPEDSAWRPPTEKEEVWALIAALSEGWDNYRHQADALRQYQRLKAAGVDDDHIVLVMADDLAEHERNPAPGVVRNTPSGPNLYADVQIDYDLSLTGEMLVDILTGARSAQLPSVLDAASGSNLYVYLVGHGGLGGVAIQATSPAEGLDGASSLSPEQLKEALCILQSEGRLRRAFIAIESCYAGVFGEAEYGGLEYGCGSEAGSEPLLGAVLMTAASAFEVSFAGSYDHGLSAWVSDDFSEALSASAEASATQSLFDLYVDVYLSVPGSHASLFNTGAAGDVSLLSLEEFTSP